MEIFKSKNRLISELHAEVSFDFDYLARTWVISESIETFEKEILKDSSPGNGLIPFTKVGETKHFVAKNRLVFVTYLDLQKINKPEEFLKNFSIKYHVVEDDDQPVTFYESEIYKTKKTEIVLSSNKKSAILTKSIEIQ